MPENHRDPVRPLLARDRIIDDLAEVPVAELAIDKQAQTLLMPVSARRQLNELPDELWTRISIDFYKDSADAVLKALVE